MLVEIETQHDVCVLHLKGRFVTATDVNYLRSMTEEIKARNCNRLLVDLSDVVSMGSTLISFIVKLYTSTAKKADGRFMLAGANPRVREVLDLTRLSGVIPMAAVTETGLAALRGKDPAALTARS
jgi:anti-anti-sigma factor